MFCDVFNPVSSCVGEEIDLSQDGKDWDSLTDSERHFVKHLLAFFTTVGSGSLPVEPIVFR